MRPGPNMKRQRGRNNGRKPHMPQRSQTFDSSGPDVRIRGNAYQVLEKYLALARDASAAGDRIAAENFYQHAEHYYRVISANGEHQRHQQHQQMHGQGHGYGQQHQPQGHDPRQGQPYEGQHQNGSYGQPAGGHPHQQPQQAHAPNAGQGGPTQGPDRQPT
ncbi:MAG TPA: DUF4167 domain-containing protein [Alphaproteobacteria bacterium]|nr:DUF4167 domain-containing protein [Alphaproteobacteria bacterium]